MLFNLLIFAFTVVFLPATFAISKTAFNERIALSLASATYTAYALIRTSEAYRINYPTLYIEVQSASLSVI